MPMKNIFYTGVFLLSFVLLTSQSSYAVTPQTDRIALKAKVESEVNKDLATSYNPFESLEGRQSIDGRSLTAFDGDIVEYWVNLECTYCGIQEPLKAQRENENIRLVVRHILNDSYGESLKKALSYEALKMFSANAANMFWDRVIPRTSLAIPMPYEASLMLAFQDAVINPEEFGEALANEATNTINVDVLTGYGRITTTPTYVLEGIRFPACNFTAEQFHKALVLAKEARAGNVDAKAQIVEIIVQGILGEITL